jgi:rhodanese-related sulfurtransferase
VIRPGLLLGVDDLDGLEAVVVDIRLALTGATGRERYDAGHVPGAAYLDVDDDLAAPPGLGGRHPLPDTAAFVAAVRRAGIRRGSRVVVYDDGPGTAAARLWSLLRDSGHDDVLVLDGGLGAWPAAGRPVSTEPVSETMSTSGWVTSACPAGSPWPAITLRTPLGRNSAASSASRSVVSGVVSAGFSTTVFPAASAGPIFQPAIMSG